MVELKTPYRYRRHRLVERTLALLDDDAVVVCFEPGAIARVRALRPELRTVQHVAFVVDPAGGGARLLGGRVRGPARDPRARSARLSGRGLATTVYTVNEPARMLELARARRRRASSRTIHIRRWSAWALGRQA